MWVPISGQFGLSINLNKGPYSNCLNPHILVCKKHVWGVGVTFPPHWRIWNVELNAKKRKQRRRLNRSGKFKLRAQLGMAGWFTRRLSISVKPDGQSVFYYRVPFRNTVAVKFKSPKLQWFFYRGHT